VHLVATAIGRTTRAVQLRADSEAWPYTTASGSARRRLYRVESLPADVRSRVQAYQQQQAMERARATLSGSMDLAIAGKAQRGVTALQVVPRSTAVTSTPHEIQLAAPSRPGSTRAERIRRQARELVVRAVRDLVDRGGYRLNGACVELLEAARYDDLSHPMQQALREACDPRGRESQGDELPSVATLRRWVESAQRGVDLTPKPSAQVDLAVRPWYGPLFALTDRPQKPTIRAAYEQLIQHWRDEWADYPGAEPPSYDAAVRAYAKRSGTDKLKGRNTGSALRSKTFYKSRDYSGLQPFFEVHADGWNSHFTAPHPVTGEYVSYELWHFHDTATRYVTPMAIGLTENTDIIMQGLQSCIAVGGLVAILQTDHTSSVKNKRWLEDNAGLAERLGLSIVHPQEVGNSQANGIAENFNTWLDKESRELATYQNPNRMDSGTFVKVRRLTNAMVKASAKPAERAALRAKAISLGKGLVFDSHAEAVAWIHSKEVKWNNRPHRSLPKVRNAAGKLVHQTPAQALQAARDAGWEPMLLSHEQLVDEFRPHFRKFVRRGAVTPFGGMRYHHADLAHYEGAEVLVAVDKDQPDQVWVKDLEGRAICEARFVEATGPRIQSMAEAAERRRAEQQIRLRERQIERITDRLPREVLEAHDGMPAIESRLTNQELTEVVQQLVEMGPAPVNVVPLRDSLQELQAEVTEPDGDVHPMAMYVAMKRREKEEAKAAEQRRKDEAMLAWHAKNERRREAAEKGVPFLEDDTDGEDDEGFEKAAR